MSMIKPYKKCKKCGALIVSGKLCKNCKPMTNGDHIRQMTDEELAQFIARPLCEKCAWYGKCKTDINLTCDGKGQLKWLKEVIEDERH